MKQMSLLGNSLWRSRSFEATWQVVLALFCLSTLISKSGLQIFCALLVLMSFVSIRWKVFFEERKLETALLFLYPLAIICGFFSLGGAGSAGHVALAWPWPLIILPTVLVMERSKDVLIAKYCLTVSLAIACLKCFYNFAIGFDLAFGPSDRFTSFWDVSRWGLFAGLSVLFLVANLCGTKSQKVKTSLSILLLADLLCLFLANNRGPWLGLGISLTAFLVIYPKIWKWFIGVVAISSIILSLSSGLKDRLSSIGSVESHNGNLTSADRSNNGRLAMWQVATDFFKEQPFFGTGFENTEQPLKDFFVRQGEEYRSKYLAPDYSYRDQHSSFLSMFVQMGGIFFFSFWIVILGLCFSLFNRWLKSRSLFDAALIAGILFHLILSIFYTSLLSFEIVSFIPLLVMRGANHGDA